MPFRNRLTRTLGIEHPVLLAPMDYVAGGRLAAAVSQAGGLGLIGGGYGDGPWLGRAFDAAGNARVYLWDWRDSLIAATSRATPVRLRPSDRPSLKVVRKYWKEPWLSI